MKEVKMSLSFYEDEGLARLKRQEQMRGAEQSRIARQFQTHREKRFVISTMVFEKLAAC